MDVAIVAQLTHDVFNNATGEGDVIFSVNSSQQLLPDP
jgi:hypothetical protein